MKIKLTKEDKIELLKAIKVGELDTNRSMDITAKIAKIEPFVDLMKEALLNDEE